jgi:HrpA-like RNA helicase
MADFPLEPIYGAVLIASQEYGCTQEVLDIISVISSQSKLFVDVSDKREFVAEARRKFYHFSGDHMTTVNAFRSYQDLAAQENRRERGEWCRKHFLNDRTFTEALKIRDQLRVCCRKQGIDWRLSCGDKEENVLRSLACGLVQNSAFLQPDGTYKQVIGHSVSGFATIDPSSRRILQVVKIHPSSTLSDKKAPAIIFDELVRRAPRMH